MCGPDAPVVRSMYAIEDLGPAVDPHTATSDEDGYVLSSSDGCLASKKLRGA